MKVIKPTLSISGAGAIIYLPDGSQTENFLKTKIEALEEINKLHYAGSITGAQQYDLWKELFNKDHLEIDSILDNIILFYLLCLNGSFLEKPSFAICTDPTHRNMPLHGHIFVDVEHIRKRGYITAFHKPKLEAIPGITIYKKESGYQTISALVKYQLLRKKDSYVLKRAIKNTINLIEPN